MDEYQKGRVEAGTEVNMTNCHSYCQDFFHSYCKDEMIHYDVLIAYWLMRGYYLGPVYSINEAYKKGRLLLNDLIQDGILQHSSKDLEMIELVKSIRRCRHTGSCSSTGISLDYLFNVGRVENIVLTDAMLKKNEGTEDGNYLCKQVLESKRGLKYSSHFNPTHLSLKPLLENVKSPSVLMLRGCSQFFPVSDLSLGNLKTLTYLEISGSGLFNSTPIQQSISKLTRLRYLCLCDPLISVLPGESFSQLRDLRRLILRGCSRLVFNLNRNSGLDRLNVLDLSGTSTTTMPMAWLSPAATHLFLRDTKINEVDTTVHIHLKVRVLDLSGNRDLECIKRLGFFRLEVLDLSRTKIKSIDFIRRDEKLTGLILRECTSLEKLGTMKYFTNLELLDVSGCQNLVELHEEVGELKAMKVLNLSGCSCLEYLREGVFDKMSCLVELDLSATNIKRLPSFANLTSLCRLSLSGLELDSVDQFETWTSLSNLVQLDLHGLKICSLQELRLDFLVSLRKLRILNLSKTFVEKLPGMPVLGSLEELLLSDCQQLKVVPDLRPLTSMVTLDLSLSHATSVVEPEAQRYHLPLPVSLRKLVLTNRAGVHKLFPITSMQDSAFLDLYGKYEIDLTGNLQEERINFKPVPQIHIIYDAENQQSVFDRFIYDFPRVEALISDIQKNATSNHFFKRQLKMLNADLKYIVVNLSRLQSSRNCRRGEELLQELMNAASDLSLADFKDDSSNLNQLLRVVVNLKLLFLPTMENDDKASETTKEKKRPLFTKSVNTQNSAADINEVASIADFELQETDDSFPSVYQSLTNTQKNCLLCFSAFPCDVEIDNNSSTAVFGKSLVIKKRILIYWWVGEGIIEPHCDQDNVEDIGEQILKVLTETRFIEPMIKDRQETGSFRMNYFVHSFVTEQAKKEGLFDFNRENSGWLTSYITRRSKNEVPSSSKLRAGRDTKELDSLRNVGTLFNAYGSVVNIKPEWFSKMEDLSVLYLGNWRCSEFANHIDILDHNFLEDLNKMKQLRLCSLQGLPTILKLPDSICNLPNLVILDLRGCSDLQELPAGIGSLKNLTHLDITECPMLTKLPKGISLLSKLEVLKGLLITNDADDDDHWWEKTKRSLSCGSFRNKLDVEEVCTLRDLVKLEKLMKLGLVVKINGFPNAEDVKVFKKMKKLRKLKIVWERSYGCDPDSGLILQEEDEDDNRVMDNLQKLELWCYPHYGFPSWVHPRSMNNLKKLYIIGGNLQDDSAFNRVLPIEILRLRYLPNLSGRFNLRSLMKSYPRLTYIGIYQCPRFTDNNGQGIYVKPRDDLKSLNTSVF